MFDKTVKEAYFTNVAIPASHNLNITTTERVQKYIGLKEELARIWQLKTACIIPLVLSTVGIIPNKLHNSFKEPIVLPVPYILM